MNFEKRLTNILETLTTGAIADFIGGSTYPNKRKRKRRRKKEIAESYNDNYERQMDRRWRTDGQADETIQFEDDGEDSAVRIPGHDVSIEPTDDDAVILSVEGPTISTAEELPSREAAVERIGEIKSEMSDRKVGQDEDNIQSAKKAGVEYTKSKVTDFRKAGGGDFDEWSDGILKDSLMSQEFSHALADTSKDSPLGMDEVNIEEAFIDGVQYVLSHPKTKSYLNADDQGL